MPAPPTRPLTALEIEQVLSGISSFRLDKRACIETDAPVFEELRYNLRAELVGLQVIDHPAVVEALRDRVRGRFLCSIVTPGISEGARAASANSEPLTQAVLKAAQAVGTREVGNPVGELLSMAPRRGAEFVLTSLEDGTMPAEWYAAYGEVVGAAAPAGLDDFLATAMDAVNPPMEPLIVRGNASSGQARGAICRTQTLIYDPKAPDPVFGLLSLPDGPLAPGSRQVFQIVEFSVIETLKLRRTPHEVLALIRAWLPGEPEGYRWPNKCQAHLYSQDPLTYKIVIWSKEPTVSLAAAHDVAGIGAGTAALESFEIIQIPTTRCITKVEEVTPASIGLLAPRRADGQGARVWLLYLKNPLIQVPAGHLCRYLIRLGFCILSCDRNAAGRCNLIRIAERAHAVGGDLLKWIPAETERITASTGHPAGHPSQEPADDSVPKARIITSWRARDPDAMSAYAFYRSIKYRGNATEAFAGFMAKPGYDWTVTYTNLIPEMARVLCTPVARQAMELEWILRVASGKVTQMAADYVVAYACGSGPMVQAVKQSAIKAGGPLAAINEDPKKIVTSAAITSREYTTDGSQANFITGSTSRHNGASSVTVVEAAAVAPIRRRGRGAARALTGDSTVAVVASAPARPEDRPDFSKVRQTLS
jgi:hypothetical protein